MKDSSFELPDDRTDVDAVARALPDIISEIYGDAANGGDISAYEKALAAHDWLVANLTYDPSVDQTGIENGVYGALINRKTMCQGYAEALQLILLSATDVPVQMQIGDGNNGDGRWMGHAWNLVFMDDRWYQVDTTFDDPVGNPEGKVSHFYFGQNDAVMQSDHKWDSSYWPAADGADFLYYRKAGLYAESLSAFQSIMRGQTQDRQPESVSIATRGFELEEGDLQFIYNTNSSIAVIYWLRTQVGDATIVSIEPEY
jgi:transglutaminase-like putative cysteine protease